MAAKTKPFKITDWSFIEYGNKSTTPPAPKPVSNQVLAGRIAAAILAQTPQKTGTCRKQMGGPSKQTMVSVIMEELEKAGIGPKGNAGKTK